MDVVIWVLAGAFIAWSWWQGWKLRRETHKPWEDK